MTTESASTPPPVEAVRWVLDTRPLWPAATSTKDLANVAKRALALIPAAEQAAVLRYYHLRDAKMALASALVKRYTIARLADVPWAAAVVTRDARTKPVFVHPDRPDGPQPVIFNVSHQAGLVAVFAVREPPPGLAIGVDIVCAPERRDRDLQMITADGWARFVDMHAEVFAPAEAAALRRLAPGSLVDQKDRALRYFYSLWCLREAYVKMTGEALLASWLGELEMRGFAPPDEMTKPAQEIWFKGREVTDVDLALTPLLDQYMVSTAVKEGDKGEVLQPGEFTKLDFEDVLALAEAS